MHNFNKNILPDQMFIFIYRVALPVNKESHNIHIYCLKYTLKNIESSWFHNEIQFQLTNAFIYVVKNTVKIDDMGPFNS